MIDSNIERIIRKRSELTLDVIMPSDTISNLVEKINNNFNQIKEYQGGRQGIPGIQGLPGCSTSMLSSDNDIDDNTEFISSPDIFTQCNVSNDNDTVITNTLEVIYNKYANKPLILSDLGIGVEGVRRRNVDESDYTAPFIANSNYDWKLGIYSGSIEGEGKHLYLMNSYSAQHDYNFSCSSGFGISNDRVLYTNTEVLSFKGVKNQEITNHRHVANMQMDLLELQRNQTSQKLKLDSGTDLPNDKSGRIQLQKQTEDNIFRLSDRTGWVGIWEDTLSSDEKWDEVTSDKMVLRKIRYKLPNTSNWASTDIDIPMKLSDESYIRFKRLNNWILIDYLIKIDKQVTTTMNVNNFYIYCDMNTINCQTRNWLPGNGYYDSQSENDEDNINTSFKILSKSYTKNSNQIKTFEINIKKNIELQHKPIYLSGQCWATIENGEDFCEPLIIVDDDSCENNSLQITD